MLGAGIDLEAIARLEREIAVARVEDDAALHAVENLRVTVGVPAVAVVRAIAPGVRAQALAGVTRLDPLSAGGLDVGLRHPRGHAASDVTRSHGRRARG